MCLINAAHEHFIAQTGKKSKTALKNLMGSGGRGAKDREPTYGAEGREPRKTNTLNFHIFYLSLFETQELGKLFK